MGEYFPAIINSNFGGDEIKAVSTKDLYEFLGLDKSNYAKWVDKSIINNDYAVEGEDYILQHVLEYESNIYILTIDFAKKISMRSNSKKGEEVRKYFIECEKIVQKPRTYEVVMQEALLLADQRVKELEKKIEIDAPKVAFAKAIEGSSTSVSIGDWIKAISNEGKLKMGRNKAFDWMRKNGYLMKNNVPFQRYVDQGLFEVKEGLIVTTRGQLATWTTLLTGKGQIYFLDKLS